MERFLFFPISYLLVCIVSISEIRELRLKFNANQYLSITECDFYCCVFIASYFQP